MQQNQNEIKFAKIVHQGKKIILLLWMVETGHFYTRMEPNYSVDNRQDFKGISGY